MLFVDFCFVFDKHFFLWWNDTKLINSMYTSLTEQSSLHWYIIMNSWWMTLYTYRALFGIFILWFRFWQPDRSSRQTYAHQPIGNNNKNEGFYVGFVIQSFTMDAGVVSKMKNECNVWVWLRVWVCVCACLCSSNGINKQRNAEWKMIAKPWTHFYHFSYVPASKFLLLFGSLQSTSIILSIRLNFPQANCYRLQFHMS